jgi:hypothetical protein
MEHRMRTIAVLVDDASYTQGRLDGALKREELARGSAASGPAADWVLIACAPRLTHRVSKWVSHGAREHWRTKWAHKLFGQLDPWLNARGLGEAHRLLAKGPLQELLDELQPDEVIDARRPKLAEAPEGRDGWGGGHNHRSVLGVCLSLWGGWVALEA